MNTDLKVPMLAFREDIAQAEAEDHFAERRRITLLETDRTLRSVLTGILLRLGCVVSAKREPAQVIDVLRSGPVDGAVIGLEGNLSLLDALVAANQGAVPLVVLTDSLPEPHLVERFPSIQFLQKPFDTRELLDALRLPEKAVIVRGK